MLPTELSRFSHLRFIQSHSLGLEYSAECPVCHDNGHAGPGKPDRFRMWPSPNARCWCRRCGYFEFMDKGEWTPALVKAAHEERAKLAAREAKRQQAKIAKFQHESYWKGWHEAMGEEQRRLWEREGIPRSMQDWFTLGYDASHPYSHDGKQYQAPSLTIPYQRMGEVTNVQFKLLGVMPEVGKYRFTKGLPASLFFTEPDKEIGGTALVVEGGKKGIVAYMYLGHKVDHVIALPSKYPPAHMTDLLAQFDRVILVLDPDANNDNKDASSDTSNERVARAIGGRARYSVLPMKIDDLLNRKLTSPDQLWANLQQGRRATH